MRKNNQDRRKVNVPVGEERRGAGRDKRRCPQCHSALQSTVQPFPGGTWTTTYCIRCDYRVRSKQVDEDHLQGSLGFEGMVVGTAKKPLLELNPKFLKISGIKPGDTLELKPLFTPGGDSAVSWIVKKAGANK
jgi:hypothetical protein